MSVADRAPAEVQLESLLSVAADARRGLRRDGEELRPLGPKAERTRASIIQAGVDVFVAQSYRGSSVSDVHERAGVSLGTYYQYFRDKTDLINTIVADAVVLSARVIFPPFDPDSGEASTHDMVSAFVGHYASTRGFQRVWEEVTHLEPMVAELRWRLVHLLETSLAGSIARAQLDGSIDPELDPLAAARALSAMVDRVCFLTFVVDDLGAEVVPETVDALARLWTNSLGMGPR